MKFVTLASTEYNRDEPTHTYVGRTKAEVMQQFRRDFAEFIDDWKHFDDDELVQRCTYNGVGMFFDEHELSLATDPDTDQPELVEMAANVAAHRWRQDVLVDGCPVYGASSALDGNPGEGLMAAP